MTANQRLAMVVMIGMSLLCVGCGKSQVSGTVMHQGKQVKQGTVQLLGEDGIPKSAIIGEDGVFRLEGLKSGEYRVAVNSPDPVATAQGIAAMQRGKSGDKAAEEKSGGAKAASREGWFPLPKPVETPEGSGLKVKLKSGENKVTIEIP